MDSSYEAPESVCAYIADAAVRQAIIDLLNEEDVPDDVSWDDLDIYYRARLAAHQFETDWGRLANRLWELIWKPVIDASWQAVEPWEASGHDASVFPSELKWWDESARWFGKILRCGERELWAGLLLRSGEGVCLVVWESKTDFSGAALTPAEYDHWRSVAHAVPDTNRVFDVTELQIVAAEAISKVP